MNTRRRLALALAAGAVAPIASFAQQTSKVWRIGYLGVSSPSMESHNLEAFRQGLRELGYIEGQNIAIEYRWAEGRDDRLPVLAAELVRQKVDVILATGTPGTLAARQATRPFP